MIRMKHKPRIGVVRGGPSAEYDVSLLTGAAVLQALRDKLADSYEPVDVLIDKAGAWHVGGVAIDPADSWRYFDLAWNALHGAYGEDGKIQAYLEAHGVPFTGSTSLASAIGMNKPLAKKILKDAGIKSPYWRELSSERFAREPEAMVEELFTSFLLPAVVKPAASGSSVGVSIVRTKADIAPALFEAAKHGDVILVEEYIPGAEATCGVIERFRGEELYALPPVEIRPKNHFFDYKAKYAGESEEIVPARFPLATNRELEEAARAVHRILGLRHYSRTDFMIHPRRGIYVLETNTLPGMTQESLIPKALRAVGSDLHELIDHVIKLALGV
jgi:D-alanine-D-alanine ligase